MKKIVIFLLLFVLASCERDTATYGSFSIGRDPTWFPLPIDRYVDNLNAFTNALVQEIAKDENASLRIVDIDWLQLFQSLEKGLVAGIFTSINPTIVTQDKYTFSDPFVFLGPVLIVRQDSKATALDELEGRVLAINQFDDSVLIAQQYPDLIIELYQNPISALELLEGGTIDGVLMSNLDAHAIVPSVFSSQLKIASLPLSDKALRLITLKGQHKSLIKYFNAGLSKLKSKGTYTALRTNFELANQAVNQKPYPKA